MTATAALNLIPARVASARRIFQSDAEMADVLGVDRSRVGRYRQGEEPSAEVASTLLGLDVAVTMLDSFLEPEVVGDWLFGVNAQLGNRRPVDVLRDGRLSEVVAAIEATRSGSYA